MSPVVDGFNLQHMAVMVAINGGVTFALCIWVIYLLAVTKKK